MVMPRKHPDKKIAERIGLMVAIGIPRAQIARLESMSLETMYENYNDELELGDAKAAHVVGGKIFEAARKGEQWACTLWAARRMGWKESSDLNLAGQVAITKIERKIVDTDD
jgi:hypothetical protein